MRTLSLEPSNPIVRFIKQIRFYRGHCHKDFPSDICALTRVFIYNLIFYSFFAFLGSLLFVSLVFFGASWMTIPIWQVQAPGIALLFMTIGLFGSLGIIALLIAAFFIWLTEDTAFWEWVGDKVHNGVDRLEEGSKTSALLAMWDSFKNKTCFRVEVRNK